jgi:hypothetical protein
MEEGIVGIGSTVAAALRAFDTQYLADPRPPSEAARKAGALRRFPKAFGAPRRPHGNPKSAPKSDTDVSDFAWPS